MNNQNMDLQAFVDKLVMEKEDFKSLSPDVLAQIKNDLLERVENRIDAVVVSNLSETDLEEFNKMIESKKSDEEIQGFCNEKIPDLAQLIATELINFQQTYLS